MEQMDLLITWYIEYEVVGAVELSGWVDRAARVDAVVSRRHTDDLDAAVILGKSNTLTAEQPASPNNAINLINRLVSQQYTN